MTFEVLEVAADVFVNLSREEEINLLLCVNIMTDLDPVGTRRDGPVAREWTDKPAQVENDC